MKKYPKAFEKYVAHAAIRDRLTLEWRRVRSDWLKNALYLAWEAGKRSVRGRLS